MTALRVKSISQMDAVALSRERTIKNPILEDSPLHNAFVLGCQKYVAPQHVHASQIKIGEIRPYVCREAKWSCYQSINGPDSKVERESAYMCIESKAQSPEAEPENETIKTTA